MANLHLPGGFAYIAFKVSNTTVGHQCIWTIGADIGSTGWTQAEADQLFTNVADALKPIWDGNVHQTGFHALVGSDLGPAQVIDVAGDVVGTSSPLSMAPPNVTYLLRKVTPYAGRRFRGRIYLPFVDSGFLDEAGHILGTTLTKLQTAATALKNVPGTTGNGVSSWMLLHSETGNPTTQTPTLITNLLAEGLVATQRRRLER